ncbi:Putative von Willebrand factor, vWF type A domain protein STM2315 [hydrothermal vent metagenome]|uniref:von Willebrand factor, vWF type A domain protein STM2315 n=1 Tax=hydrothermal vent metagenome TaxID=652676 RepID=A0A3B0YBY9_9ZZZZ
MFKPNLILASTLTTLLVAGCAETGNVQTSEKDATSPLAEIPGRSVAKSAAATQNVMADLISLQNAMPMHRMLNASEPVNRENYHHFDSNPVKRVSESPVSTFSVDVDTGSYSNVRRMLNAGQLPVQDAVRIEELVNYFDYSYPAPDTLDTPFQVTTEIGPNPWNENTHLLHIGIKGYQVEKADIPAANLVFLVDVSGSMQSPNKLELLKKGMKLLVKQLRPQDRVSIVVYAGASGLVLEPTPGDQTFKITQALNKLTAGGSTNGGAGIRLAYEVAQSAFIKDGVNRILLATDGDFNVGTTNFEQLIDLVETRRDSGIGLSTFGFGSGNYNDHLAEQLANKGNGMHTYIDTLNEANKVLVNQLSSTLLTIAKDVKIQVEFNPAVVSEYRLVGYENRKLNREDFNNDKIDAGEIGAGHTVTALYEITLAGSGKGRIDPLRYGNKQSKKKNRGNELALLRLRYKQPGGTHSKLIETPLLTKSIKKQLEHTTDRYRFAAAVAGFAQQLRGGEYLEDFAYDAVLKLARNSRGSDQNGYRGEFIQLVQLAKSVDNATP